MDKLKDTLAATVIHKIKAHFARHGIPDTVVTDNGPQFASGEFRAFAKSWRFNHDTSSPHRPQGNGKVENSVNTCKNIIKKCADAKTDIYLALLDFRNTPSEKIGFSPAERLFGRRAKTRLPLSTKKLSPQAPPTTEVSIARSQTLRKLKYKPTTGIQRIYHNCNLVKQYE